MTYMMAQLVPWTKDESGSAGFLLVLGSTDSSKTTIGNLTKYDCSASDINPIGSINKTDLC